MQVLTKRDTWMEERESAEDGIRLRQLHQGTSLELLHSLDSTRYHAAPPQEASDKWNVA